MEKITLLQSRVLQFILLRMGSNGTPPTLRETAQHFGWKAVGSAQDVLASLRKKGFLEAPLKGRARQTIPSAEAYALFGISRKPAHLSRSVCITEPVTSESEHSTKISGGSRTRPTQGQPGKLNGQKTLQTVWNQPAGEALRLSQDFIPAIGTMDFENNAVVVPLVGTVRAGHPQEAINSPDRYVTMPAHPRMKHKSLFYAVEVEGFSMIGAGLLPGDVLLIESQNQAKNGDLVLAAVGPTQEVTFKRFALKGSLSYRDALSKTTYAFSAKEQWPPALLCPENSDFDPIPFGLETSDRVLGLVRSLYRSEIC